MSNEPPIAAEGAAPGPRAGKYAFLDPPQEPGELGRLGEFRIRRMLGEGGMGIVFEAEDLNLGRHVALKVVRPNLSDEKLRDRFIQEARAVAQVRNDHVVTIYQVGRHRDVPFLVMEYLVGESVEQRLRHDGWLPIAEALRIARQVALGLHAAHAQGLVHRDVKPANVWLETDKPGGTFRRVKLIDFGLARPMQQGAGGLTARGQILGTPWYMAPEQITGGTLDGRTDLYALGCTLYRMLTGQTPVDKDETIAALQAVMRGDLPPIEQVAPQVPPAVADLLRELLSTNPNDRPASGAVVAERIRLLETTALIDVPSQMLKAPATASSVPPKRHPGPGVWIGVAGIVVALVAGALALRSHFTGRADKASGSPPEAPAAPK